MICHLVVFAVLAYHRMKKKESEKIGENLNLTRELKRLCNMKVTVIPILVRALGAVTKVLERRLKQLEIRGRIETIQIIAFLRLARILRRVLES